MLGELQLYLGCSDDMISLVGTVTPLTFSDHACDHRASKLELGLFSFRLPACFSAVNGKDGSRSQS